MKRLLLLAAIHLITLLTFAADRYWVAGIASNWNNSANWSTTNGGAGGASVPGVSDRAVFTNNGLGNCTVDVAVDIGGIYINGYNGSIDLNGNVFQVSSGDVDLRDGSIDDGTSTSTFLINTAGASYFRGVTINTPLSCTSGRIYLNGSIFNQQCTFLKNGAGNDAGTGGNTFNAAVNLSNSSTGYLMSGNSSADIFNGDLTISNTGSDLIYLAHNSAGNQFNENILIEATGSNTGIRFCQGGGSPDATLAATKTLTTTGAGVDAGDHRFDHFTQTGATAQNLTFTGTATFRTRESNWGGDLTVSAPNLYFELSTFNGLFTATKTGTGNDNGVGGNTFAQDVVLTNTSDGDLGTGNGNPDNFQADLDLLNSGSNQIRIAINSPGNNLAGNLSYSDAGGTTARLDICENSNSNMLIGGNVDISISSTDNSRVYFGLNGDITVNGDFFLDNSCSGDSHYSYLANGTDSEVIINGTAEFQNNGTGATVQRIEPGVNGDVTFNGDVTVINASACVNSEIFFNINANSNNQYNGNLILSTTDASSDGIRFGQSGGSGTLAAGQTITIGAGGFIAGELQFRNFTQLGATAQNITLTGTARFYNYDSNWGGNVVFSAPRMLTRGTTYNGTAELEKSGGIGDDASAGGNTFVGDALLINSGSEYFLMGNGSPDDFQGNLEIRNSGSDRFYLAYNSAGNAIAGDLDLTNSGTTTRLEVCSNTASTLSVGGACTFTNTSTADCSTILGNNGSIDFGSTLSVTNSAVATNSYTLIANGTNSSVTIDGAFDFTIAGTISNNSGSFIGNNGDVVFNSTCTISNQSGANSSQIYVNHTANSLNTFNDDIILECTDANSDGIYFGNAGGAGLLVATRTVSIGAGGYVAGDLQFRNFTQVGPTAQSLTCTGTARIYNYDSNWGGDISFIAPRMLTRGTTYNGATYLEKTGALDDQSAGGNTFVGNSELVNSGSGYFMMGNGDPDDWQGDLLVNNTGTDQMYICHNSAGNQIAGTLEVNCLGNSTRMEICDNSNSSATISGNAVFTMNSVADNTLMIAENGDIQFDANLNLINQGTANTSIFYVANGTNASAVISGDFIVDNSPTSAGNSRSYIGNNGDITVDGDFIVTNASGATNSEIYIDHNTNSTGIFNGNIVLEATDANGDGIRFGQSGGNGTLAATRTVTIGGGGFVSGDLQFRNFTQVGPTAQSLTCTGTARIYNYDSDWGGDVNFVAPRMLTRGTTYNGTSYLEKTGANNDQSVGGNTFVGDCQLVHTGSNQFLMGNGVPDEWQSDLDVDNFGSGNMYIAHSGGTHTIAGTLTWEQSATANTSYLATNTGSALTVDGVSDFTNLSGIGGDIYIANNGGVTFNNAVSITNTPASSGTGAVTIANGSGSSTLITGSLDVVNNGSAPTSQVIIGNNGDVALSSDLNISNNGTGASSYSYVANGTNSAVQIDGNVVYTQSGSITNTRGYFGNNGDITFNGDLSISNNASSNNSEVYLNFTGNSANNYNGNITVTSENANCDGVRFGQNGGSGILAASQTVGIGAGGFIAGDLRFRNFVQLSATPQSITCTGDARIFQQTSIWNGAVTFIAPRYYTRETTYQLEATITKNGSGNDDSYGGNTYNGTTIFTHDGSGRWRLSSQNGNPNDHNADVSYIKTGTGNFEPTRNNTDTYSGDINFNTNTQITLGAGGNGRVLMDGGNAQSINDLGASPNPIFRDLQINKIADDVTLNMPVEINVELDLDQGRIFSTSTNLLFMRDNSTVSSVSNASHVDGPVEKIGNDAFTFPVGNAGIYAPCSISAPSNASHRFRGQYFYVDPDGLYSTSSLDAGVTNVSRCEYWTVDRTNGTSNVVVNLSFENVRSCGVTDPSQLLVVRWDGALWENNGNGGTTGTAASGTVNSFAPISSFSPFTLASTDALINPLPVELVHWDASREAEKVRLEWTTETEINNDYFVVERSLDGLAWEQILQIDGSGNSTDLIEYSDYDENPEFGINYYRLKQVDFDGTEKTFDIKSVHFTNDEGISLYPNPSKDYVYVKGNRMDLKKLTLYNAFGQIVVANSHIESKSRLQLDLSNLERGVYFLSIEGQVYRLVKE